MIATGADPTTTAVCAGTVVALHLRLVRSSGRLESQEPPLTQSIERHTPESPEVHGVAASQRQTPRRSARATTVT